MIQITLPWPPSQLSPNRRLHWAALAKHKAAYRAACAQATPKIAMPLHGGIALDLVFFRPNKRIYDRDNLLARMKSGIDGMCDRLGFDDRRFTLITIRVSDVVVADGRVSAIIRPDE